MPRVPPELKEHIYTVGRITLSMSFAEYQIEQLLELYLGEDTARVVIEQLGRNRDKSTLLRGLIDATEKDTQLAEALRVCISAYAIHRENRNKLAHAYSVALEDDGTVRWERASGKATIPIAASEVCLEDLNRMVDQLAKLNGSLAFGFIFKAQELGYGGVLSGTIQIGRPSKPPVPDKFPDIDPQALEVSLIALRKRAESTPPSTEDE